MKKQVSSISRFGLVAIAAGSLCFVGAAFAQNEAPKPTAEAKGSSQEADPTAMPTSGMAPVGQKPRKPRPVAAQRQRRRQQLRIRRPRVLALSGRQIASL
jgi:hypothetical protein